MRLLKRLPQDRQTQLYYSVSSGRVLVLPAQDDAGEPAEVEARFNALAGEWSLSTRRPRLGLEQAREAIRTLYGNLGRSLTVEVAEDAAAQIVGEAALTDEEKDELRIWYREIREAAK